MFATMTTEVCPGYIVTEEIEIVTYDDLIATHHQALLDAIEETPNA